MPLLQVLSAFTRRSGCGPTVNSSALFSQEGKSFPEMIQTSVVAGTLASSTSTTPLPTCNPQHRGPIAFHSLVSYHNPPNREKIIPVIVRFTPELYRRSSFKLAFQRVHETRSDPTRALYHSCIWLLVTAIPHAFTQADTDMWDLGDQRTAVRPTHRPSTFRRPCSVQHQRWSHPFEHPLFLGTPLLLPIATIIDPPFLLDP